MNPLVKMYYENTLDTFKTRLKTIGTKEKINKYKAEIIVLKMMIVLITNLLNAREDIL